MHRRAGALGQFARAGLFGHLAPLPGAQPHPRAQDGRLRRLPGLPRARGHCRNRQACPDRPFCRRSSGVVYTNTGNYTGSEPWTCQEAQIIHKLYDEAQAEGAAEAAETHGRLGKY